MALRLDWRSLLISLLSILAPLSPAPLSAQWITQNSGTRARLRGLAVVNANVVWASGTQGTLCARPTAG